MMGKRTNTGLCLLCVKYLIDITSFNFHNNPVTWLHPTNEKIQVQEVKELGQGQARFQTPGLLLFKANRLQ